MSLFGKVGKFFSKVGDLSCEQRKRQIVIAFVEQVDEMKVSPYGGIITFYLKMDKFLQSKITKEFEYTGPKRGSLATGNATRGYTTNRNTGETYEGNQVGSLQSLKNQRQSVRVSRDSLGSLSSRPEGGPPAYSPNDPYSEYGSLSQGSFGSTGRSGPSLTLFSYNSNSEDPSKNYNEKFDAFFKRNKSAVLMSLVQSIRDTFSENPYLRRTAFQFLFDPKFIQVDDKEANTDAVADISDALIFKKAHGIIAFGYHLKLLGRTDAESKRRLRDINFGIKRNLVRNMTKLSFKGLYDLCFFHDKKYQNKCKSHLVLAQARRCESASR